jgi:hypothetical protein
MKFALFSNEDVNVSVLIGSSVTPPLPFDIKYIIAIITAAIETNINGLK